MKPITLFFILAFSIFSLFPVVEAQKPRGQTTPKPESTLNQTKVRIAQTMSSQQASEMLQRLYYEDKLNPFLSPYAWPGYTLSPENCFGFVLSNGSRVLGVSERRDQPELLDKDGNFLGVNIGLLYSESAFYIEDKTFEKGVRYLWVSHDKLTFTGKGELNSLNLSSKLDDSLIKGAGTKPRFSITQYEDKVLITIESNKFTIIFKE